MHSYVEVIRQWCLLYNSERHFSSVHAQLYGKTKCICLWNIYMIKIGSNKSYYAIFCHCVSLELTCTYYAFYCLFYFRIGKSLHAG